MMPLGHSLCPRKAGWVWLDWVGGCEREREGEGEGKPNITNDQYKGQNRFN